MNYQRKSVNNYPNYQVDTLGQIFSCYGKISIHDKLGRYIGTKQEPGLIWRKLSGSKDDFGRLRIGLRGADKLKYRKIHSLIMETFIGLRPNGMVSRHLNGNVQDNRLENLAYGTQKENMHDRVLHGTSNRGENAYAAKLKNIDIPLIWELLQNSHMSLKRIGELFNVQYGVIANIKNGYTYKDFYPNILCQ